MPQAKTKRPGLAQAFGAIDNKPGELGSGDSDTSQDLLKHVKQRLRIQVTSLVGNQNGNGIKGPTRGGGRRGPDALEPRFRTKVIHLSFSSDKLRNRLKLLLGTRAMESLIARVLGHGPRSPCLTNASCWYGRLSRKSLSSFEHFPSTSPGRLELDAVSDHTSLIRLGLDFSNRGIELARK